MNSENSFSGNEINDFNVIVFNGEWESQVQYIIDKMNRRLDVKHYIEKYEEVHNRKFEFDYVRYMYSYLKHIMIDQALYIYDTLVDEQKNIMVDVIDKYYPHLYELVEVHNQIKFINMDTDTNIIS